MTSLSVRIFGFTDSEEIVEYAQLHSTFHPTIPFEIFFKSQSKRVYSKEEAIKWLEEITRFNQRKVNWRANKIPVSIITKGVKNETVS